MAVEPNYQNARARVTDIYNSAVAAYALSAAWEIGALDELHSAGTLNAEKFAVRHGLDPVSTVGMFRALSAVDIVRRDEAEIAVSSNFAEAYRNKSFFHWLTRGTAELFRRMPTVLDRGNRVGDYVQRDSAAVAFACREINELTYDPTFWSVIDGLDFDFRLVADLGCGSGGRLMDLLSRYPGIRGLGVDIARPAIEAGRVDLDAAGLGDRVEFTQGDVLQLAPRPEFAEVDLVTCFMMGHDFWPREQAVHTLRRLRTVFPAARRLVLGDATRVVGVPDAELPIFVVGFELGHSLMDRYIPTVEEWEPVFEEGGWELLATHRINMTVGEVIFELG